MAIRHHKTFLVVEGNADDALLIRTAFKSLESCQAIVTRNVSEAKAYMEGAGMYQDRERFPLPNALICDLGVGSESALEFIKGMKQGAFTAMPVFALTGVATPATIKIAKDAGALEIFPKPVRYEDLVAMLKDLAAKLCG